MSELKNKQIIYEGNLRAQSRNKIGNIILGLFFITLGILYGFVPQVKDAFKRILPSSGNLKFLDDYMWILFLAMGLFVLFSFLQSNNEAIKSIELYENGFAKVLYKGIKEYGFDEVNFILHYRYKMVDYLDIYLKDKNPIQIMKREMKDFENIVLDIEKLHCNFVLEDFPNNISSISLKFSKDLSIEDGHFVYKNDILSFDEVSHFTCQSKPVFANIDIHIKTTKGYDIDLLTKEIRNRGPLIKILEYIKNNGGI